MKERLMITLFFSFFVLFAFAQTCTPQAEDNVLASPSIDAPEPEERILRGYSEVVVPHNQPMLSTVIGTWQRDDCPHLRDGLLRWEDAATWESTLGHVPGVGESDITLPEDSQVIISGCSIDGINNEENPFGVIYVPASSALIFDDTDIELHVKEIKVEGALTLGSDTCRLFSNVKIVFHGSKGDSSVDNEDTTTPSKGIKVYDGKLDIHGKQYHPTWTRLAANLEPGSKFVYIQDAVNWEVGQKILVVTSKYLDCPEEYQEDWCKPCWGNNCDSVPHENEIRTIVAIDNENHVIEVDAALTYDHYAGKEYQTEVALLSRRIELVGTETGDKYGAHVMVSGHSGEMRISGTSCSNCGQQNILGRYPFHFHLMGDGSNTHVSYFQDSSVINSNFRSFVVHGTNNTRVLRNIAYNVWGMSFYLEDGVEEKNIFMYNLAAHTHPILKPADGGWGQEGEDFAFSRDRILPADASASGYYVSNSYNTFIGNGASGGWSGFAFPNIPYPINEHKYEDYGRNNPMLRPNMENGFIGNTAHSSGFYWLAHGACIYVGAWLNWDDSNQILRYSSGRYERGTQEPDGTAAWMYYNETKTWMCNRGLNHWGSRAVIQHYESHDNLRSAVLFGESSMKYSLVNARSSNTGGLAQQSFRGFRQGFEFYDTWVKTILSYITFRNFNQPSSGDQVILYMTHSDEFLPQGINHVRGITFENCPETNRMNVPNCGEVCGETKETMSARMASVYDFDGSLSGTNKPSIIGSHLDWWELDEGCDFISNYYTWRCDWNSYRKVAYIVLYVPGIYDGCDNSSPLLTTGTCVGQNSPYTVGYVSQFGRDRTIELSPWPGVAGHSNIGWYWRTPWGAPSRAEVGKGVQIPRGHFVVVAMKYPKDAQIQVTIKSAWWASCCGAIYDPMTPTTKERVLSQEENLANPDEFGCGSQWWAFCDDVGEGAVGPAYHWDSTEGYLYLRVVNFLCYNRNGKNSCVNDYYEEDEMKLYDINSAFFYDIQVTSCPGCSVARTYSGVTYYQTNDVNVPAVLAQPSESVALFTDYMDTTRNVQTDPTDPTIDDGYITASDSAGVSEENAQSILIAMFLSSLLLLL
eukprot:TRINITY_DN1621_c0_g1_i1.p1 TRINITY_DN1621_c0_g1~~TRINITY_DN1621_c0_g1_i1.p1  ORF type:complete len:1091 (-),score=249.93 TRINITY_DN1621_c0_g1_i1:37-3309(-)